MIHLKYLVYRRFGENLELSELVAGFPNFGNAQDYANQCEQNMPVSREMMEGVVHHYVKDSETGEIFNCVSSFKER